MFAGYCGVNIMLDCVCNHSDAQILVETLFDEELCVAFQVHQEPEISSSTRASLPAGPPGEAHAENCFVDLQ